MGAKTSQEVLELIHGIEEVFFFFFFFFKKGKLVLTDRELNRVPKELSIIRGEILFLSLSRNNLRSFGKGFWFPNLKSLFANSNNISDIPL